MTTPQPAIPPQPALPPMSVSRARSSSRPFFSTKCPGIVCEDDILVALAHMLEAEPTVWAFDDAGDGFLEALVGEERILFAVLPSSGLDRERIKDVADKLEARGRRVCLVPEANLRRQPARANRELVSSAGAACLAPFDRVKVLDRILGDGGSSTLGEVACLVSGGDDPVAGVLSLVVAGVLRIDMDRAIDAESRVERIEPALLSSGRETSWT